MTDKSDESNALNFERVIEIVGVIGIIVSLVFLGYELKRANDIAESEAIATIYEMTNEVGLVMLENPDLSNTFRRGLADFDALSQEERWSMFVVLEYVINVTEAAWKYHDEGVIEHDEAEYYTLALCKLIKRHPSLIEAWRANREDRLPGFHQYVTAVCEI